ncbi:MAG: tetratricopeptide repeat protein [Stenomitos rutilans HA7619-LM2]|nr:tetratricopeptide repeat protein [Stenomitos rutilans HA7619-LM2]
MSQSSLIVLGPHMGLAMFPSRFTAYRFLNMTVRIAIALMILGVPVLSACASDNSDIPSTPSAASLLQPKTAYEWVKRGLELAKANDLDGAIASFNQAIALKLDYADAYYNRGTAYAKTGNVRAALADYSQVILLKPNNAAARYSRGSLRTATGNKEGAIADFQQAATLFKQQLNLPWQQKALDNVKQLQQL